MVFVRCTVLCYTVLGRREERRGEGMGGVLADHAADQTRDTQT
jgi:hypothetical protein